MVISLSTCVQLYLQLINICTFAPIMHILILTFAVAMLIQDVGCRVLATRGNGEEAPRTSPRRRKGKRACTSTYSVPVFASAAEKQSNKERAHNGCLDVVFVGGGEQNASRCSIFKFLFRSKRVHRPEPPFPLDLYSIVINITNHGRLSPTLSLVLSDCLQKRARAASPASGGAANSTPPPSKQRKSSPTTTLAAENGASAAAAEAAAALKRGRGRPKGTKKVAAAPAPPPQAANKGNKDAKGATRGRGRPKAVPTKSRRKNDTSEEEDDDESEVSSESESDE